MTPVCGTAQAPADRAHRRQSLVPGGKRAYAGGDGTLHGEPGAYVLASAPGAITMPATVQAIIAERIDRLVPHDKHLLQTAAVIGYDVPWRVLAALAERTEDDLQHSLQALQAAEFLYHAQRFPRVRLYLQARADPSGGVR